MDGREREPTEAAARLALITGASSGIGEAYAGRLAADGWDLMLVARRLEKLEEIASQLRDDHGISVRVRVRRRPRGQAPPRRALHGAADLPVSLLVNNAALAHYMPFATCRPNLRRGSLS